jgi:hypothetical protein
MEVGSYLTWEGWPRYRVFQDPRINGYPPSFHALLRRDRIPRPEWDALLDHFGVTAALLTYPGQNPRIAFFDPERWALVYEASDGMVFVRRLPEFRALIAREEIPVSFAVDHDNAVTRLPIEGRPATSPVPDCEWQRRLGDFFAYQDAARAAAAYRGALAARGCLDDLQRLEARRRLGDAALSLRDPATAADAYAGIDLPDVHIKRAFALLALGRAREALDDARAALAKAPADPEAQLAERLARERLAQPGR